MKKIVSRGACLLLASCLSLNAVGCQKSNENNKIKEGQSISSEEAGMSINANGKNETFKPSDYTLEAKKEYVYEYLGLKFKLSNKFKKLVSKAFLSIFQITSVHFVSIFWENSLSK